MIGSPRGVMHKFAYATISELAARYGVTLRTLRFYEQRGLLQPTRVRSSRLYTERDQLRLELILTAKRFGFSLTETARIIEAHTEAAGASSAHFLSRLDQVEIDGQITSLERERQQLEMAISELQAALAAHRPTSE
jgi:DNA-binding transcriptional MerR regulator